MKRSIDFYTKFLGLELVERHDIPQNNAEIAFLQDHEKKGSMLELTLFRNQVKFIQADFEDRLFDHLAFSVEDIKDTIAQMRAQNVVITDEPFRLGEGGSLIAFIEDPDGTLIELVEKPS